MSARTSVDATGAEIALRLDYATAGAALGALLGRRPAPDFAQAPPDADTLSWPRTTTEGLAK